MFSKISKMNIILLHVVFSLGKLSCTVNLREGCQDNRKTTECLQEKAVGTGQIV